MKQACQPDHGLRRITHDAGAPDDMLMGRHFGASARANTCLHNVTELNEQGTVVSVVCYVRLDDCSYSFSMQELVSAAIADSRKKQKQAKN